MIHCRNKIIDLNNRKLMICIKKYKKNNLELKQKQKINLVKQSIQKIIQKTI